MISNALPALLPQTDSTLIGRVFKPLIGAILVAAGLLVAPEFASADFQGIYQENTDRPRGDYRKLDYATVDSCMQACDVAREACVAFTHVASSRTCWLKDTLYPSKSDDSTVGMTSGIKTTAFRYLTAELNTDRPGGDYRNFPVAGVSPAICAEECQGESQCLAYTYVPPRSGWSAHCWLKDSKPEARSSSGLVSGIKPNGSSRRAAMSVQSGTRRLGASYASYEMVSRDPNLCRQLCGSLASCEAWSFKEADYGQTKPGGTCFLQPETGQLINEAGWFSGRRLRTYEVPHHPSATHAATNTYGHFNASGFVSRLRNRLNRFQGYGMVVIDPQGREVATLEDGYRIHPVTGSRPKRFRVDTPTRIGSISKAVTAVAVLRGERARRGFLDTTLRNVLPYRWRSELYSCFSNTTFRDLLSHRSGMPNQGGSLRDVLDGPAPSELDLYAGACADLGKVQYSNYGIETFNLTMAYALSGDFMHLMESFLRSLSDSHYDWIIRNVASFQYRAALNSFFFHAGVKVACRTSDTSYPSYFYTANFQNYSTIDRSSPGVRELNQHCAQGALVMSTRDLAKLFHTVVNTNKILTDRQKELLLTPDDDLRLGLFRAPGHQNGAMVATHNGAHPGTPVYAVWDGALNSHSELLIFPDGYVVAFNANSPQREGESARDDIIAAYNEARVGVRTPLFP